jgi:hypothetical protein
MANTDPEIERMLDEVLEDLLSQDYEQGWLSEALFVMALDLRNDPNVDLQSDYPQLDSAVSEVLDNQPEWVLDLLQETDLPSGFARRASNGDVDVIDVTNEELDHEFLMYPGDDFFEVLVRQYYPIICGENSVQAVTQKTREQKNVVRTFALLLISQGLTPGFSILPFVGVYALHLVEENIDEVCDKYDPY